MSIILKLKKERTVKNCKKEKVALRSLAIYDHSNSDFVDLHIQINPDSKLKKNVPPSNTFVLQTIYEYLG